MSLEKQFPGPSNTHDAETQSEVPVDIRLRNLIDEITALSCGMSSQGMTNSDISKGTGTYAENLDMMLDQLHETMPVHNHEDIETRKNCSHAQAIQYAADQFAAENQAEASPSPETMNMRMRLKAFLGAQEYMRLAGKIENVKETYCEVNPAAFTNEDILADYDRGTEIPLIDLE